MQQLTPRELAAILAELQRQVALEQYHEQRNHWAFLAAVITNGLNNLASVLGSVFGGKRRKPKTVEPDDFISKDLKKISQQRRKPKQQPHKWGKHVDDAKAKGLKGPWNI